VKLQQDRLKGILDFLAETGRLKDTLRSGYTAQGRQESTAEHTWRLCLWVMLFEGELGGIDITRLLKICIVHDLGEAISGDIPAPNQNPEIDKSKQERADLVSLLNPLQQDLQQEILEYWDEYEAAQTPEAKFAKGFDKLETIMQHNGGKNPSDFDYEFSLGYGTSHTSTHPLLKQIRQVLDQQTKRRMV